MDADQSVFRFGRFTLDPRRREFLVDGKPVVLHARTFDLLLYLIEHRDAPVSRDAVLAHVWAGRIVSQNNLSVQLHALRKALAEGAGNELILTLPGPCYRFVGDLAPSTLPRLTPAPELHRLVEASTPTSDISPAATTSRRRARVPRLMMACLAIGVTLIASTLLRPDLWLQPGVPRLSIVVLPFDNLSRDRNQDYLAQAISDDLTIDLAHIPASTVIARESAQSFKAGGATVKQIGRDLHVQYVLSGQLRVEGSQYQVTVELSDTLSGTNIWGRTFHFADRRVGDVREAIVGSVATELKFQIDQIESFRSLHDRPNDPNAIDLFFQARAILDVDDSRTAYATAQTLLESAITKQPEFVDALSLLGWMLLRKGQSLTDIDYEKDRRRAHEVITQAQSLAHRNSEAMAARALELEIDGKCYDAEHVAANVLDIEFSNVGAQSVLANCAWEHGELDAATLHLDELERINPDGHARLRRHIMQAHIDMLSSHPGDAVELLRGVIADYPDPSPGDDPLSGPLYARILLSAAYAMNGQLDDAKATYDALRPLVPNLSVWRLAAYQSKAVERLPRNIDIVKALHAAGMVMYAPENAPPAATCPPDADDFSPTPDRLPLGRVIDTAGMIDLLKSGKHPLVVDVGMGVAAFPDAKWEDHDAGLTETLEFVERVARLRPAPDGPAPIIIMGSGPFGCGAFSAAKQLASEGYAAVTWYRGGEEAWSHSGQHFDDHRLY